MDSSGGNMLSRGSTTSASHMGWCERQVDGVSLRRAVSRRHRVQDIFIGLESNKNDRRPRLHIYQRENTTKQNKWSRFFLFFCFDMTPGIKKKSQQPAYAHTLFDSFKLLTLQQK